MKFTKIYENTITRHVNGGLLTGDLVKFKKNAIHYPAFEDQEELKFLMQRCDKGTTTVAVAAELALRGIPIAALNSGNSLTNNRNVAFNRLVRSVAGKLGLPWVDTYASSNAQSRGVYTGDHAHYYSKSHKFVGDEASRVAARQLLLALL